MPRDQPSPESTADAPDLGAPPTEAEVRTADLEAQEEDALRDAPSYPEGDGAAPSRSERDEAIRQAAYAAYLRRGASPGSDLDDWLEAERAVDSTTRTRP